VAINKKALQNSSEVPHLLVQLINFLHLIYLSSVEDGSSTSTLIDPVAKASAGHIPLPFLIKYKELIQK
jgi:hypothetical protein